MNCILVAVCVNIAFVNAVEDIGTELIKFIKIIKGRRSDAAEINEPEEVLPMMPGFFMTKPSGLTKSQFKHPAGKSHSLFGLVDKVEITEDDVEAPDLNTDSKDEYLMTKILKGVRNLNGFQDRANYRNEKTKGPISNIDTNNENFKASILKAIKNGYYSGEDYSNENTEEHTTKYTDSENVDLMTKILNVIKDVNQKRGSKKRSHPPVIVIEAEPNKLTKSNSTMKIEDILNGKDNEDFFQDEDSENDASEILDEESWEEDDDEDSSRIGSRRRSGSKKDSGKHRSAEYTSSDASVSRSGSTENEKNPGNPFTIHKNKYKQNWLWNHYMDGDHMNINPSGPQFASLGPSGPDLFFGRKWWYFNQDDYKPMG